MAVLLPIVDWIYMVMLTLVVVDTIEVSGRYANLAESTEATEATEGEATKGEATGTATVTA